MAKGWGPLTQVAFVDLCTQARKLYDASADYVILA